MFYMAMAIGDGRLATVDGDDAQQLGVMFVVQSVVQFMAALGQAHSLVTNHSSLLCATLQSCLLASCCCSYVRVRIAYTTHWHSGYTFCS